MVAEHFLLPDMLPRLPLHLGVDRPHPAVALELVVSRVSCLRLTLHRARKMSSVGGLLVSAGGMKLLPFALPLLVPASSSAHSSHGCVAALCLCPVEGHVIRTAKLQSSTPSVVCSPSP